MRKFATSLSIFTCLYAFGLAFFLGIECLSSSAENVSLCVAKSRDRDTDTEDAEPKPKKQKTAKSGDGKGKNVGFLAPCPISEQLARFLDAEDGKISRADAVRRMWDYIKENNLQVGSSPSFLFPFLDFISFIIPRDSKLYLKYARY